jgi:major vault protein
MEERRPRERELVLSPNEYAYVLDTTKGHINCYVGPNKTSLAQTDELVVFNPLTKRFDRVSEMSAAVQLFATAPAGWYLVLKNPAPDNHQPSPGVAAGSPDLRVGRKVIVQGPVSFALWPGQLAKVVAGHRLRSNQYLVVRCYDAEAAQQAAPDDAWMQGEKRIIKGTETSFYVPSTGLEVVPEGKRYVRDAVSLQRLEYCVLVAEDGRKRYVRGEAVVFPEPSQRFVSHGDASGVRRRSADPRVFKAIELNETTGIYVKVIAPYAGTDDETGEERSFVEGEELFVTGKNRLYFPREEHAIIRYGDDELHHAVAIPEGEGRYLLQRQTGSVSLVQGPRMLLPDPRREVIVRRVLTDRECLLMFPGNAEVLRLNRALREGRSTVAPRPRASETPEAVVGDEQAGAGGDQLLRKGYKQPRTLTLDTRKDGAVSIDIWAGFAVQIKNRVGDRRVVQGPATLLLGYTDTVEALTLSTGRPKSADRLLHTAFLQLSGNSVSDEVELVSQDLVRSRLSVRYRVAFEGGQPERWFAVDNYVQLLCDHASSKLKAMARRYVVHDLRAAVTDLVRDTLLGARAEDTDREGLVFEENGMRVYDIEVLEHTILDDDVRSLLADAELSAVQRSVEVAAKESQLAGERRAEAIERALLAERQQTSLLRLQLQTERAAREHEAEAEAQARLSAVMELERSRERRDAALLGEVRAQKLQTELAAHEAQLKRRTDLQALELARLRADVEGAVQKAQAFSPHLVDALHRLGDEALLGNLSANFSELAAVEGRGLLETARKFLDFVPSTMMPTLSAGTSGADLSLEARDRDPDA